MTDVVINERLNVREFILDCERCELFQLNGGPVPFMGPTPAEIAVVCGSPDEDEAKAGKPLMGVGLAMLEQAFKPIGVSVDDVFICNALSCVGSCSKAHLNACSVNLRAQLDLASPKWVLCLGGDALKAFRPDLEIGKAHGHPFQPKGEDYVVFPAYSPSVELKNRLLGKEALADVVKFGHLMEIGDAWVTEMISDHCILCKNDQEWLDHDGIPWCKEHLPEAGRAYFAAIDAELQEARARRVARDAPPAPEPEPDIPVPVAHARTTDPETSHMAAAKLGDLRPNQAEVLALFRTHKEMMDEQLLGFAEQVGSKQTDSGLRTRRSELVELGLVRYSGRKGTNSNGNASQIWELVTDASEQMDLDRLMAAFPGAEIVD